MNIEHLREFAYLAETLSFTATARHFFLSVSVLSKHIASMEEDLQAKLFERDRRHVSLTAAGECFYRDTVVVLNAYDRAISNVGAGKDATRLRVRVGYLRGAARPFLPKFVQYMEKTYPDVELELECMEYGELIRAHRSHKVDVVFNMDFDPEAVEACDFEKIYADKLYVVVGKKHRLAKTEGSLLVGELAGERLVLPDVQAYPGLAQRYQAIVQNSCDTTTAIRYKDIDTLHFRIVQGGCVGLSSGHNYRQFEERAVFLPLQGIDTSYFVSAQWLKGMDLALVEIIRDAAKVCAGYMQGWTDGVS